MIQSFLDRIFLSFTVHLQKKPLAKYLQLRFSSVPLPPPAMLNDLSNNTIQAEMLDRYQQNNNYLFL